MSDHLADTIRLRVEAGESVSQIARSAGVYRTTVSRFLAGRTIFDSTRAKLSGSRPQAGAELVGMIRSRIDAGESISQIARSAGVEWKTVKSFVAGRSHYDSTRAKLLWSRPQTEAERDTIRHAAAQAGARGRHMIRTTVEEFEAMLATPKGKELVARLHRQQAEWDAAQEAAKTNERTPPTGG